MDIDQREVRKGPFPDILPEFYPNSISYLSELNEYRMYAEMWINKASREYIEKKKRKERSEIGHEGYLKTLELGEKVEKRRIDRIRFEYFVVADSLNYTLGGEKKHAHIQMGSIRTNSIFNEIIEENEHLFEIQSQYPSSTFHSDNYVPGTLDIDLENLDLQQDKESNKFYFEISTGLNEISNRYQKEVLVQVLGEDVFSEKMQLLYNANRKHIRCLFENPENVGRDMIISRLCVAWPFYETIVVDFAGTIEDYGEACTLGILIKKNELQMEDGEFVNYA